MTMNSPPVDEPAIDRADHALVGFHPPVLLAASLAGGFVAGWVSPLPFLPASATITGFGITVLAFVLFGWAARTMSAVGSTLPTSEPTAALALKGPYRWSRNPVYLSMVLLLLGVGMWTNNGWFLLLTVAAVIMLSRRVIQPEEAYLERTFGDEYLAYKKSARRWL